MNRCRAAVVAGVAVVPLAVVPAMAGSSGLGVPARSQVLIPVDPQAVLPLHGATVDSLNWAGYAVAPPVGKTVTAVATSYVVPTAGALPPGFSATWTGIGGYSTSDLIQAGTEQSSLPDNPLSGPQYSAWYEMLPAASTPLTNCSGDPACTVNPGDTMTVSITNAGVNRWTIDETDVGHWTWSKTVTYRSSGSSAEWIQEAPTVGVQTLLANDGTVTIGPGNTFTLDGGSAQTIAAGNPVQIVLSPAPGVLNEATPSPLGSDGDTFNVCSYS